MNLTFHLALIAFSYLFIFPCLGKNVPKTKGKHPADLSGRKKQSRTLSDNSCSESETTNDKVQAYLQLLEPKYAQECSQFVKAEWDFETDMSPENENALVCM